MYTIFKSTSIKIKQPHSNFKSTVRCVILDFNLSKAQFSPLKELDNNSELSWGLNEIMHGKF